MKKGISLLFLVSFFSFVLMTLFACKMGSDGLTADQAMLANVAKDGQLTPAQSNIFKRGEAVGYVLVNVSKFKKDKAGLNWFDMDLQVKDPDGKVLLEKKAVLGNKGHIALPDDIVPSPHAVFVTSSKLKPGKYTFSITIYDKIGKGSVSKSTTFILK
ncbi:MAG: hypothetical protein JW855_00470 [Gammaproteobacteria bacterium]|nr:hypothetical protein [Gammaproteobacteria bacterium]